VAVGLPVSYSRAPWSDLRATMSLDKKARGATLRFVLLDGLRHPVIVEGPDENVLADAYAAIAS
ncbi:MAG TPA: 3-dehydroquinate synthase, partial [Propionibacteriaceae bacterium]